MEKVTIEKAKLLARIKENLSTHREVFEAGLEQYEKELIAHIQHMLKDARAGKRIERFISLEEPEDHTPDYTRVITMLELSKGDEVTITEGEFNRYVMDQWGWNASFAESTAMYAASNVQRPAAAAKAVRMTQAAL